MAAEQKQKRFPVPLGGIDTQDSPMYVGPEYGVAVNNFFTRSTGLEVRKGFRRWLPYAYAFADEVQTLMYYSDPSGVNNTLFAVTSDVNSSIYDITLPDTAPAAPFVPGIGATTPGEMSWINVTTPAASYLGTVLHGVGYFLYTSATGWAQVADGAAPGQILFEPGVTTADMLFIFTYKNRVWFLAADKATAWYLPVNQVTGTAAKIELGVLLAHGGGLAFATPWTYDAGSGMDDNLVFVGNNGDMLIWEGDDPAVATDFQLRGKWYIGRVPPGRRGFTAYGGDVLVVTEYGIVSVSDFVSGKITSLTEQSAVGGKFNPTLSRLITQTISERYWQLISYPSEEQVVLLAPVVDPDYGIRLSFTMGHFTKAWSSHTSLPGFTGVVFEGRLFTSSLDGKVFLTFNGPNDDASYDSSVVGTEVTAAFQAGFYDYGTPTANKTVTRLRLLGTSEGRPAFAAYIRSEYDLSAGVAPSALPPVEASVWDVGTWDIAVWQIQSATLRRWIGVAGFGKKLAVQIIIRGAGKTTLTDYEVTYKEGNGL